MHPLQCSMRAAVYAGLMVEESCRILESDLLILAGLLIFPVGTVLGTIQFLCTVPVRCHKDRVNLSQNHTSGHACSEASWTQHSWLSLLTSPI